jgi:hypothetical protein
MNAIEASSQIYLFDPSIIRREVLVLPFNLKLSVPWEGRALDALQNEIYYRI